MCKWPIILVNCKEIGVLLTGVELSLGRSSDSLTSPPFPARFADKKPRYMLWLLFVFVFRHSWETLMSANVKAFWSLSSVCCLFSFLLFFFPGFKTQAESYNPLDSTFRSLSPKLGKYSICSWSGKQTDRKRLFLLFPIPAHAICQNWPDRPSPLA